jgi:ribosomal protein L29
LVTNFLLEQKLLNDSFMKIKDLKNKDSKTLVTLLNESKVKLNTLTLNNRFGKVKNFKEINDLKKTIARILTIINKK